MKEKTGWKSCGRRFRCISLYYIMVVLFAFSVITGIYDVFLPVLAGAQPFYHLAKFVDSFGYVYLFLHLYLHNIGLACMVPAVGLIAMFYERDPRFRPVVLNIPAFTSLLILYSGWAYMRMEITRRVLIVFLFEMEGILIMALASYSFMYGMEFRETRNGGKRVRLGFAQTIEPVVQKILPYFIVSALALAAGAFFEARIITGV